MFALYFLKFLHKKNARMWQKREFTIIHCMFKANNLHKARKLYTNSVGDVCEIQKVCRVLPYGYNLKIPLYYQNIFLLSHNGTVFGTFHPLNTIYNHFKQDNWSIPTVTTDIKFSKVWLQPSLKGTTKILHTRDTNSLIRCG